MYDESSGQYNFQSMLIMKVGAAITVIALLATLVPYWLFSSKADDETDPTKVVEPAT